MATRFGSLFVFILFLFFSSTGWGTRHQVNLEDFTFSPPSLTILAGDTVVWEVAERCCLLHTVTRTALPNPWDSGPLDVGQTFQRAFPSTGTFSYFCNPHAGIGMLGSITVQPRPAASNIPSMGSLGLLLLAASLTAAGLWILEQKRKTAG